MTAEEIRKRLEDAGLAVTEHDVCIRIGSPPDVLVKVNAIGPLSAWQKVLGPTKDDLDTAIRACAISVNLSPATEKRIAEFLFRCLYP